LGEFFNLLGQTRSTQVTHVSSDGAEWIHDVVVWASTALDAVRRGVWNQLRRRGEKTVASEMKNTAGHC